MGFIKKIKESKYKLEYFLIFLLIGMALVGLLFDIAVILFVFNFLFGG